LNYNQDGDVLYSVKVSDNIILENNLFCYYFRGIRILSLPDLNSGFKFKRTNYQATIYQNTEIGVCK